MALYTTFPRNVVGYNVPYMVYGGNVIAPNAALSYNITDGPGEVLGFSLLQYSGISYFYDNLWVSIIIDGYSIYNSAMRDLLCGYMNKLFHNHAATNDILFVGYTHFITYDRVHYVVAENSGGGALNAWPDFAGPWQSFSIIENSDSTVSFLCWDGVHYIQCANGGGSTVDCTATSITNYAKFTIEDLGTGYISFRCYDGVHWLTAINGGGAGMTAQYSNHGAWDWFYPAVFTSGYISSSYRFKMPYESTFKLLLTNKSIVNLGILASVYSRIGG